MDANCSMIFVRIIFWCHEKSIQRKDRLPAVILVRFIVNTRLIYFVITIVTLPDQKLLFKQLFLHIYVN